MSLEGRHGLKSDPPWQWFMAVPHDAGAHGPVSASLLGKGTIFD